MMTQDLEKKIIDSIIDKIFDAELDGKLDNDDVLSITANAALITVQAELDKLQSEIDRLTKELDTAEKLTADGTVRARFTALIAQLEERLGISGSSCSSIPPEIAIIAAIDWLKSAKEAAEAALKLCQEEQRTILSDLHGIIAELHDAKEDAKEAHENALTKIATICERGPGGTPDDHRMWLGEIFATVVKTLRQPIKHDAGEEAAWGPGQRGESFIRQTFSPEGRKND